MFNQEYSRDARNFAANQWKRYRASKGMSAKAVGTTH